eukprot:3103328-Karenia_brevis.AAC.1
MLTSLLLDWVFVIGCALHDAHNGLRWGTQHLFRGNVKEGLKDLFICNEALRNSYDLLVKGLVPFLKKYLCFRDATKPVHSEEDIKAWWMVLGVPPDWLQVLVDLDPFWSNGYLYVNRIRDGENPNTMAHAAN